MSLANTFLSIHMIEKIRACTLAQIGTPLVLTIESEHGTVQLTLFFRDENADAADRIASAIEAAQVPLENPPHSHDEAAAYHAQISLFEESKP